MKQKVFYRFNHDEILPRNNPLNSLIISRPEINTGSHQSDIYNYKKIYFRTTFLILLIQRILIGFHIYLTEDASFNLNFDFSQKITKVKVYVYSQRTQLKIKFGSNKFNGIQIKLNNNCVLSLESLKSDRQFIVLAGEDKGKHLMIIAWDLAEFQKYELELPKIKFQTTFAINKQESIKLIPDFTEFIDEELKFNLNNLTAILRIVSEQYQDKRQQIYQQ